MPYNMMIMNSSVLIIPRKHMSEAINPDVFAPAMFEFFGCFRINKEQQWDKGDQKTYNYCC